MTDILEQLTTLRKERGIRQVDVAEALGISQPVVSELEAGKTALKVDVAEKYAELLGLDLVLKERAS